MNDDRARRVAKELQLLRSGQMETRFHGESMRPFLLDGDRVVVEPVAWEDIVPGDLVTYRLESKFPTRRVVHKSADALSLWCDNWPYHRWRVSRADLLGRAVARERDGAVLERSDPEWTSAAERALAKFRRNELRGRITRLRNAALRLLGRASAEGAS